MYNYSGVVYRLWAVFGILFLVLIIDILISRPWSKKIKFKHCIAPILICLFVLYLGAQYSYAIVVKDVYSYTGNFVEESRNSSVAPPLPLTFEYVFWNGHGTKKPFYLDIISKKEVFPQDFEDGKTYKIYYDKYTKVIVKVEMLD